MNIIELDESALRQYIDSRTVFVELERTRRQAGQYRGGMVWVGDTLIRTSPQGGQRPIGPRTVDTEAIYAKFTANKASLAERTRNLETELKKCRARNFAENVGRAPALLVNVLNRLEEVGILQHFLVVGTHALYAYEQAAGIRIMDPGAFVTRDADLLWDTRKRIKLVSAMKLLDSSFLGLLKGVDKSFRLSPEDRHKAINDHGFEIDILRCEADKTGDPHPLKLTDHEDEFWAVQARNADKPLSARRLSTMIVTARGAMARMNTIAPETFVAFKRWMARQPDRESEKRSRDLLQAEIVEDLLERGLFKTEEVAVDPNASMSSPLPLVPDEIA